VNASTLYRWETSTTEPLKIDPFPLQLLTVLQQQLRARKSEADRRKFAEAVLGGLAVGGGLLALFTLLQAVFDDGPAKQRRTGGAGARPTVGRTRSSPNRRKR
jgi:hypothetical protein